MNGLIVDSAYGDESRLTHEHAMIMRERGILVGQNREFCQHAQTLLSARSE
jgi:hypothetical protein